MSWPGRTHMQAQSAATGHVGTLSPPRLPSWRRAESKPVTPPSPAGVVEPAEVAFEWTGPFALFCIYTFVLVGRPQDYLPVLVPLRPAMLLTVASVAVALIRPTSGAVSSLLRLTEAKYYMALFAAMVWTIPFAMYRPSAFDFVVMQYVVQVVYFVLFVTTVTSLARFRVVAVVVVFAHLLFTWIGLRQGAFEAGRYSVGGEMYDPNDVAFVELSLMAFSTWVMAGRFSLPIRALAGASAIMGALLTLYTGSRGGLIGLIVFLLLLLTVRVAQFGRSFRLVVIVSIFAAASLNADKINLERFKTLGSLESDYNLSEEWGRADIWERGFKLFMRDPLTGVGVTNFGVAIGMMRWDEKLIPKFQAPHSAYLEILTETGVFGSTAFLLLVGSTLWTFNRVRRLRASTPSQLELASLGGVLLVGFVAQLVVAAFLTQAYSMFLTLSFSAAAALHRLADEQVTRPGNQPGVLAQASSGPPTFKLRPKTKTS